jgi:EmrB/QacA subfamily drug resistance transporter
MPPGPQPLYGDLVPRRRAIVMAALLALAFLAMLDGSVIVTTLPKIVDQIGGNDSWYFWLVTAYLLASSISVPIYGRFSDLHGRRSLLLIGLALFVGGSLACGLAGSMEFLIGSRVVQGLGAGALLTLSMATIREIYPPGEAGGILRIQSLIAVLMVVGMVGGPPLGGLLADHASWRWAFFLNVPIGAAAFVALAVILPTGRRPAVAPGRLDIAGIGLLAVGLSLTLVGLSLKGDHTGGTSLGWTDPAVAVPLVVGLGLLAVLVPVERRAVTPILPLTLLRRRSFSALLSGGFFFQLAAMPVGIVLPLYFQNVRGYSASVSGLLLLPLLAGMALSSRLTAVVILRTGRTKPVLVAGAVLVTTGAAAFLFLGNGTSPVWTSIWLLMVGLGNGPAMGGLTIATQNSVPRGDIGSATAGSTLAKQLGGTLGLTLAQSVANHYTQNTVINADAAGTAVGWIGGLAGLVAVLSLLAMDEVLVERPVTQAGRAPAKR